MTRAFLTRAIAARVLSIGVATLDRLIARGQIRVLRVGRAVRIPQAEIVRLGRMRARRIETGPPKGAR